MKVMACIHSLDGGLGEIEIITKRDNYYLVKYKDVVCTAIFNPFVGRYYADDIYGIVQGGKV